jgi:hypothetical protein
MKVDGACHCGRITFTAEVDPKGVRLCHCTDCQALSGSAFRANIMAARGSFVVLSGEPRVYVKIADSGARRAHGFCGDCGSAIYATSADSEAPYSLRIGVLAQRAALTPSGQIWRRSALSWVDDIGSLPRQPKQ